jgi:hypothetical protein
MENRGYDGRIAYSGGKLEVKRYTRLWRMTGPRSGAVREAGKDYSIGSFRQTINATLYHPQNRLLIIKQLRPIP